MVTQPKILVVGNYCHDTLITPHGRFEVLGGSSSYISAALKGLGTGFRLVAKVGRDFRYSSQVSRVPLVSLSHPTTHFIDDTTAGERKSVLKARCEEIRPEDIGNEKNQLAIASGVAGEITPALLTYLRSTSEIIVCDAQGLVRFTDLENRVLHRPISETGFQAVLGHIDYLKMSESEARSFHLGDLPSTLTVFLTLGKNGCDVIQGGQTGQRIPPFPAQEVDATGAGDCFLAGFAHALVLGKSVFEAAREGSRLGAIAVGQVGVPTRW